jgi:hypothetical protein
VDLSFSRFETDVRVVALSPDLAVLMVGVAARQAASPTALVQARLPRIHASDPFTPLSGRWSHFAVTGGKREPAVYRDALASVQVQRL